MHETGIDLEVDRSEGLLERSAALDSLRKARGGRWSGGRRVSPLL
jgi:hypothetical protein